ncbi:hypothetical protein B0H15DRAFT_953501 [Mycena belliarum]|uniref:C2H2-type domain-containing protein n=1 Tax=Mycena belliarum TaxID=1033014 RepID=A0AAD6XK84_9AGAR|nr:hypothetical protein B0H15DRAFT_953501 [Mycena belliae]
MSQDSAALSLLSLSIAASNAQPIPLADSAAGIASKHQQAQAHHRRISSTSRRRRLSDARDAAARPSSAGLSMAALSLSSSASPPPTAVATPASAPVKSSTPIPIASTPAGRKKRGVDHKCESCSKIYRHPSCLIKHRWEHTPHWRTLSSLPHPSSAGGVLSKHAQVQMLEAAAILSHLSTDSETGTSLPEDRGMWPRWVSGGALEGEPGSVPFGSVATSASGVGSVGGEYRSGGPRLHDYEVPRGAEVRAGVVEVPHRHVRGGGGWSVPRSVSVSASVSSEQSRTRSTPSDDSEGDGEVGVWKHEEDDEFGFEFDLGGVREEEGEEGEDEMMSMGGKAMVHRRGESLRWGGMEEMDDIDMDMD